MIRKQFLVAFLAAIMPSLGQSQSVSRVNDPVPTLSPVIQSVSGFTGWTKNDSGQWVSGLDAIPNKSATSNEKSFSGGGEDNCTNLELRTVTYNGKTYPCIVRYYIFSTYNESEFRYVDYHTCDFYIFHSWPTVIQPITPSDQAYIVDFKPFAIIIDPKQEDTTEATLTSTLSYILNKKTSINEDGTSTDSVFTESTMHTTFSLLVFPVNDNGNKAVRFLISKKRWRDSETTDDFKAELGLTNGQFKPELTEFDSHYYEMPRADFERFWSKDPTGASKAGKRVD